MQDSGGRSRHRVGRSFIAIALAVGLFGGWLGFWSAGRVLQATLERPTWLHLELVARIVAGAFTAVLLVLALCSIFKPPIIRRLVAATRRALSRTPLWTAIVLAVFTGLGLAFLFNWAIAEFAGSSAEEAPRIEVTRTALAAVAGIGGAVALVVAYRRQRDVEQGRFVGRFGAAAAQLGDGDVAVRIAGVYAMAGVADESTSFSSRQQCIDVLCGYLRLPYEPKYGTSHLTGETRRTGPDVGDTQQTYQYRQNDREVRRTIVRVITAHLVDEADTDWSLHNFDFTEVRFEDANFNNARFRGEYTSFVGAEFSGSHTGFVGAEFGGDTRFIRATFASSEIGFDAATFSETTHFDYASFSGEQVSYAMSRFEGKTTFDEAKFSATVVAFGEAKFKGETTFVGATFSGALTTFGKLALDDATGTKFTGKTRFVGTNFVSETLSFIDALFSGQTSFAGATFGGEYSSFQGASFKGGHTTFANAVFTGGTVDFSDPSAWKNIHFDWDENPTATPSGVLPPAVEWPPAIASVRTSEAS